MSRKLAVAFLGLGLAILLPRTAGPVGGVYTQTKHGDTGSGVSRTGTWPVGSCEQCHLQHDAGSPNAFALFAANTNGLCATGGCHDAATPSDYKIYQGPTTYAASKHGTSTSMWWPGADASVDSNAPPARLSGDWGKCINCHDPHGYNRDGTGLIPSLAFSREEKLCIVCHDGSPASKNVKAEFSKTYRHPSLTTSGKHSASENGTSSAYGASPTNNRHAECVDCHNPHLAKTDASAPTPPTASSRLLGVSRLEVANGAAGTVPTYAYRAPDFGGTPNEYEVCFKCHSSWTTLPAGAKDKAVEFNPNNESFHPVEGAGTNTTAKMTTNLNGGTGLPHLTTTNKIWCTDCHNNDSLPTNVSTVSNYTGAVPRGPHGSDVGTDTNMSAKILRANYRVMLMPYSSSNNYSASNFTLCFICHTSAPFTDTSGNTRTDTNFRFHGYHLSKIYNNPGNGVVGNLDTPGDGTAGQGNAVCKECHYSMHSSKLTYHSTNRSYARLVSFSPSLSGAGGSGAPAWSLTGKSCTLKCHGKNHSMGMYTY